MSEELNLERMKERLLTVTAGPWVSDNYRVYAGGHDYERCLIDTKHQPFYNERSSEEADQSADMRFVATARQDIPALIAEIEQLRAVLGSRGVQEELEMQIMRLQTYAMNWQGTEFGGLIERDKVLAALRGVGTPQEKEVERYDAAHERFQRSEIRALEQTVVALVRQLTAAHLVARVTPLDLAVDPVEVSRRYDPATGDDLLWVPLGTLHQEEKAPK